MATSSKIWLITGAAGVLGQALIRLLIAKGDDCIALDKNRKGLESMHDEFQRQGWRPPALYPMDLSGAGLEDMAVLAQRMEEEFGRLDHLVHAANHFVALRPLMHQKPEEWMQICQVGIHAPVFLTQALLGLLQKSATPTITFVTDPDCIDKPAHWGAYGLTQPARVWLAQALGAELGPKGPRVRSFATRSFMSPIRQQAMPANGQDHYPDVEGVAKDLIENILQPR